MFNNNSTDVVSKVYLDDMASHQTRWVDWQSLTPEERQKRINKSRNYIRYKLIKGLSVDTSSSALLTSEEKLLINLINDNRQAIKSATIALLRHFYENCPKVGSTLVRKVKPEPDPTGIIDILNESLDGKTEISPI